MASFATDVQTTDEDRRGCITNKLQTRLNLSDSKKHEGQSLLTGNGAIGHNSNGDFRPKLWLNEG